MNKFFRQQKGAVIIEFAFMLILLCLLIAFMTDLFIARSTIGKLDRTSYSLLNVIKERAYSGIPNKDGKIGDSPSQDEVEHLMELANRLLFNDKNERRAVVFVEPYIFEFGKGNFRPPVDNARKPPFTTPPDLHSSNANGHKGCQQPPIRNFNNIVPLSEIENKQRFVPIIRVTVCIPEAPSLFLALMSFFGKEPKKSAYYTSSSVGVVRASSFVNSQ
ncbi:MULTISPECIES: tight adherence pilus pseudopilin TadF [unclassified Avibacterium]|uniref:tight adherence pilus pseudopilin TadF n=1 Tax=unclassified Avibacterium TaxID=2685287 RepID=UPI002025ED20|nr:MULTISPECIES: tight adherence pilus pseudopilin TadF [unclassified Avibacterium]MCW9698091.1 hypothetical protein [Avibacterium sp. 20-129]URL05587.1 hypothetical protein L4F92_05700 [Avibacterium sp. 21-595]